MPISGISRLRGLRYPLQIVRQRISRGPTRSRPALSAVHAQNLLRHGMGVRVINGVFQHQTIGETAQKRPRVLRDQILRLELPLQQGQRLVRMLQHGLRRQTIRRVQQENARRRARKEQNDVISYFIEDPILHEASAAPSLPGRYLSSDLSRLWSVYIKPREKSTSFSSSPLTRRIKQQLPVIHQSHRRPVISLGSGFFLIGIRNFCLTAGGYGDPVCRLRLIVSDIKEIGEERTQKERNSL